MEPISDEEEIVYQIRNILSDEIYAEYPSNRYSEAAERVYKEVINKKDLEKIRDTQELIYSLLEESDDSYTQHTLSQAWRKLDDVLQVLGEDN